MSDADDDAVRNAITDLLEYLRNNPYSADTFDGIRRWWLIGKPYPGSVVKTALEYLVEHNKLFKQQRGGNEYYFAATQPQEDC